jgi:RimJ/RimL family protein N-acetyltransferase
MTVPAWSIRRPNWFDRPAGSCEHDHMSQPPAPTKRLAFREMTLGDLDDLAALLGDPEVMLYYPHPKDRDEALGWIRWNQRLYRDEGYGLWIVILRSTGEFVGDCGLTPQEIEGTTELEVGYHVRSSLQGHGYATEAAAACRDYSRDVLGVKRLIAIIHPDNVPSQRVAEKAGLRYERDAMSRAGTPVRIYAAGTAVTQLRHDGRHGTTGAGG